MCQKCCDHIESSLGKINEIIDILKDDPDQELVNCWRDRKAHYEEVLPKMKYILDKDKDFFERNEKPEMRARSLAEAFNEANPNIKILGPFIIPHKDDEEPDAH